MEQNLSKREDIVEKLNEEKNKLQTIFENRPSKDNHQLNKVFNVTDSFQIDALHDWMIYKPLGNISKVIFKHNLISEKNQKLDICKEKDDPNTEMI